MYITWQTLITMGAVLGAVSAILALFRNVVRFVDRQKKQDEELVSLRDKHNSDMCDIKQEQRLLIYGILACLKGLKEQGCNGPVTDAIHTIEKHINEKAHE